MKNGFVSKVKETLSKYKMLEGTDAVTVALSGGKDSVSLLFALKSLESEYGIRVSALHVNHSIRGEEADRDEEFCKDLCGRLGVPIKTVRVDAPAFAKENRLGLEEAARILRYRELEKEINENSRVATAHTASDSFETLIFNLVRGASADGLCGIPPVRDGYIRPLILSTSDGIAEFIKENGLDFVTDSTNSDESYTRNFIRRKIVPLLKRIDANAELKAADAADALRADKEYFEKVSGEAAENASVKELARLPDAILSRALVKKYRAVTDCGEISHVNVSDAMKLVRASARDARERVLDLPGRIRLRCGRDKVSFEKEAPLPFSGFTGKPLAFGLNRIAGGQTVLITKDENDPLLPEGKIIYKLPSKNILENDTITVRSRRDGDAYRSKGVTHRVKKLFSDAKLPLAERDSLPVFCDGKGIFWIPGFDCRDDVFDKEGKGIYIFYIKTGE